jgi:predicted RNA polymerase sigma factor
VTPPESGLEEHLFRRESGRIVAALTRIFGVHNLTLAEDVAQDAFCRALEVWKVRGVPDNPAAWLMTAAKNRAFDVLRRERTARTFAPELIRLLDDGRMLEPVFEEAFAAPAIRDGQLRLMFSCCHPRLPQEVQIALVLNVLCGFGAPEIAAAFLASRGGMEKRLSRGKKTLAAARRIFDLSDSEFVARLSAVRTALYLLFSEGYHGSGTESAVRIELCEEAMRLVALLREYPPAATPETDALAALMYLHAARLPARLDAAGDFNPLIEQNRSQWDRRLIEEGLVLLEQCASGSHLTAYHVEAAIAAAHASAATAADTDWTLIVSLYDRLIALTASPVVALNRAIAIAQRDGPEAGLDAHAAISSPGTMGRYPFFPAARGELELQSDRPDAARAQFAAALALARSPAERRFLEKRMTACATREA